MQRNKERAIEGTAGPPQELHKCDITLVLAKITLNIAIHLSGESCIPATSRNPLLKFY